MNPGRKGLDSPLSTVELDRALHFILWKQHLSAETRNADITQIVRDVGGLHATGATTPYMSLFARHQGFEKEDLHDALYVKRTLGKIRCMRKTIHVLTREMIPIAFGATLGMVEKASREHLTFRGVPSEAYEAISKEIMALLEHGGMTASEIKKELEIQINVAPILYLMCDQGLLIRDEPEKGWRDRNHRYSLFHRVFPDLRLDEIEETVAVTLLVHQYLGSYGPSTVGDIAWWTGLGKRKVQAALDRLRDKITYIHIEELEGDFLILEAEKDLLEKADLPPRSVVNLLPSLDPYIMGYKERERYLDLTHYNRVFDRSGNATSTILIDGKIIGVWDFEEDGDPVVKMLLFNDVERSVRDSIDAAAQEMGRFIADQDIQLRICKSMIPLTGRTAGSFMSPLKDC